MNKCVYSAQGTIECGGKNKKATANTEKFVNASDTNPFTPQQ